MDKTQIRSAIILVAYAITTAAAIGFLGMVIKMGVPEAINTVWGWVS